MNLAQHILLALVRLYRLIISPALGAFFGPAGGCRFTPTCSAYAADAVRTHGAFNGSWLATKRLCRCHPWGGCGHDPVLKIDSQITHIPSQPHAATSSTVI